MSSPVEFIQSAALGTRMTVRRRLHADPSGARFTDAVGYLRERSATEITVEARHGLVTIAMAEVTAAKAVPPPPARRAPKHPLPNSE